MGRKNEDDFGGTEKKVRRLLGELGIPRTGQGFSVVADAVVMALESEEVYGSLTKEIYPEIAKKRGKSAAAVRARCRDWCCSSAAVRIRPIMKPCIFERLRI